MIAWCISGFPWPTAIISICNLTFFLLYVFYRRWRVDMNCSENYRHNTCRYELLIQPTTKNIVHQLVLS